MYTRQTILCNNYRLFCIISIKPKIIYIDRITFSKSSKFINWVELSSNRTNYHDVFNIK